MGSSFNTGQVLVSATVATMLVAQNTGRKSVVITNLTTVAMYIGPNSSVTTSNGQLLPGVVGASLNIPSTSAVWGVASGAGASISFMNV